MRADKLKAEWVTGCDTLISNRECKCHWLIVEVIQSITPHCDPSCLTLSTSNWRLKLTRPPWPWTSQTGRDTCCVRGLSSLDLPAAHTRKNAQLTNESIVLRPSFRQGQVSGGTGGGCCFPASILEEPLYALLCHLHRVSKTSGRCVCCFLLTNGN